MGCRYKDPSLDLISWNTVAGFQPSIYTRMYTYERLVEYICKPGTSSDFFFCAGTLYCTTSFVQRHS
jgi:hypothetical protein